MVDKLTDLSKASLAEMLSFSRERCNNLEASLKRQTALIDELNKYRIKLARAEGYIDRVKDEGATLHEIRHEDQSVDFVRVRPIGPCDAFDRSGNNSSLVHTKDRIPF